MNILSWLFGKGIAGAISQDILKKYFAIKSQHLDESDENILVRVWNFWLTLNEEKIISENDKHKIVRLNIIKEQNEGKKALNSYLKYESLFDLYKDIVYIETEISSTDGKVWHNAMKVFLEKSSKYGLDFSKEYESYMRILG